MSTPKRYQSSDLDDTLKELDEQYKKYNSDNTSKEINEKIKLLKEEKQRHEQEIQRHEQEKQRYEQEKQRQDELKKQRHENMKNKQEEDINWDLIYDNTRKANKLTKNINSRSPTNLRTCAPRRDPFDDINKNKKNQYLLHLKYLLQYLNHTNLKV